MTTRAQLSAAPTSSTARNTNAIKVSVSMVVVWLCGMGCPPGFMIPAADAEVDALDDPAGAPLAASGSHPRRFLHFIHGRGARGRAAAGDRAARRRPLAPWGSPRRHGGGRGRQVEPARRGG